ncbi:MAG: hypothetical protein ACRDDY_16840 [Clostridium sp.]|uniref:hypothetical protein n=1 Tax=Clostridium sp. TaxID=1506 RepID=UPI003EE5A09D
MRKLNLVIADKDERYIKGITSYITNNHMNEFKIVSITDEKYLEQYLASSEVIDILLIDSSLYGKIISRRFINTIIILSPIKENNKGRSIYKFQSGGKIYLETKKIYMEDNPEYEENLENIINTVVNTVYSPIGGIGKTIISISMLLKLASKSKEVLYLNFEDLASTETFFKCNDKSMSDLLYLAKDRNKDLNKELLNYLQRDNNGVYYFSPVNSILDYEIINSEDINYFIESLKELRKFDYIIIDLSATFSTKYSSIINLSNSVTTILGNDKLSSIKVDHFLKQQESLNKYNFIINKYENIETEEILPSQLKKEKKTVLYKIEYFDFLQGKINSIEDIQGHNSFGISISEVIEKIFN